MDGGKTWKKVLYVNDGVGAIDLVINRKAPATLYAAMYDKERKPWQIVESGPESGIYRTDDGGDKWQQLTGGLPTGKIGRIGLDIYQKNPLILYALLENQNPKPGAPARDVNAVSPLAAGIIGNEIYRTDDGGKTWRKVTDVNVAGGKAPYSFNQMRIDPHDDQTVIVTSDIDVHLARRRQDLGDRTSCAASSATSARCGGTRDDKDRIILGSDGGVSVSVDGGKTADYFPNMGVGEVYAVGRRHGRSLQRLRRHAGSRFVEGPEQRPDRAASRSRTGSRSAPATACTTSSIRPTAAGSTTPAS